MRGKRQGTRAGSRSSTRGAASSSATRSRSRSRSNTRTSANRLDDEPSCSSTTKALSPLKIAVKVVVEKENVLVPQDVEQSVVKVVDQSVAEPIVVEESDDDVKGEADENMDEQPDEDDGDDLKCLICANLYKDPRLLHCMHTFCNGCIDKLQKVDEELQAALVCPICQCESKVGADGKLSLLRNHFIQRKVKQRQISVERATNTLQCCNCETETATELCTDCQLKLCTVCSTHHTYTKKFSNHSVVTIKSVSNQQLMEKATIKCPFHSQEMAHFCDTCNMAVCGECLHSKAHQRHLFLPLTEVIEKQVQSLDKVVTESDEVCKAYEDYLKTAEEFYAKSIVERDASKKRVESEYTKLVDILMADKQQLLAWLDSECESGANGLKIAKERVSHVKALSSYLEQLTRSAPTEEVFDILKDGVILLKDNIQSMKSVPGTTTTEADSKGEFVVKISLRKIKLSQKVFDIRKQVHQIGLLPQQSTLTTSWPSDRQQQLQQPRLDGGFVFDEVKFPGPAGVCKFEVQNVRKIFEAAFSEPVTIGQFLWKICLKPAFHVKDDGGNVLGFNLYRAAEISLLCEPVGTETSWECRAHAEMVLKNQYGADAMTSNRITRHETHVRNVKPTLVMKSLQQRVKLTSIGLYEKSEVPYFFLPYLSKK